ncbi:MAG: (Fe-S)-binding protein, partial [Planctomycetota bacterium]
VQVTGAARRAGRLLGRLGTGLPDLPRLRPGAARRRLSPLTPARGPEVDRVAVLEGCVMPELFPHVNRATVESLAALGVASLAPDRATCCGSLHAHNGDLAGARRLARRTIAAFAAAGDVPIVVNSAGCGAHMKEYPRLLAGEPAWRERAAAFAARVVDYSVYVAPRLAAHRPRLPPGALPLPAAWDDPCHLCHGQGVRAEPRAVLAAIAGLSTRELPDSEACCGSAGLYSLLRPADSRAVFAGRLAAFRAAGARTLVTANPGCQLQWETELRRAGETAPVVHLAELVAAALAAPG